ncbi:MAG: DeoR family transcriptional regulator [Ktedonobacteraceae bacterium]
MDEQREPNPTPQTTPAEVSLPVAITPALPVVQNEAIEAKQVETPHSAPPETPPIQTPQIESPLEEPLRQAIIVPKEVGIAPQLKVTPTPHIEEATLPKEPVAVADTAVKARAAIQSKKRKKLDHILEEVAKKGSISNNEVEKLLGVSDATASRYLVTLQKEGRLTRLGSTGKAVRYQLA